MTVNFARTIPILASLDIAETSAFYADWLGFAVCYRDGSYLIAKRDDMELHFWKTDDRRFPENTSCYIRARRARAVALPGAAMEHEGILHP